MAVTQHSSLSEGQCVCNFGKRFFPQRVLGTEQAPQGNHQSSKNARAQEAFGQHGSVGVSWSLLVPFNTGYSVNPKTCWRGFFGDSRPSRLSLTSVNLLEYQFYSHHSELQDSIAEHPKCTQKQCVLFSHQFSISTLKNTVRSHESIMTTACLNRL